MEVRIKDSGKGYKIVDKSIEKFSNRNDKKRMQLIVFSRINNLEFTNIVSLVNMHIMHNNSNRQKLSLDQVLNLIYGSEETNEKYKIIRKVKFHINHSTIILSLRSRGIRKE